MSNRDTIAWRWSHLGGALLVGMLVTGCGGDANPTGPEPTPPGGTDGVLPDTLAVAPFLDSIVDLMPGEDSDGYDPPSTAERQAIVGLLDLARSNEVSRADSLADAYGYDIETAIDAVHGDMLIVLVERAPVQRGWGTYILRPSGIPADVHINHPLHDLFTPLAAAALYDACRCRALLMAGTHRYANSGDEADMARSESSIFQAMHEELAADADMVVSVHNFARTLRDGVIGESDVVLSLGADEDGDLEANDEVRALRDAMRNAGFVAGLVADDDGYNELTGEPNPQGRYSNEAFGHGRWIHAELAAEMFLSTAWTPLPGIIADWLGNVVN